MRNLGLSNTSCCHWLQYISCKEDQAVLVQTIFLVLNALLRSMLDKIDFRFELHVFPLQCISYSSTFLGKHCGSRLIILFQKWTIQTFRLTLLCVQPMSPLIAAMEVNMWTPKYIRIALFWIESTLSNRMALVDNYRIKIIYHGKCLWRLCPVI